MIQCDHGDVIIVHASNEIYIPHNWAYGMDGWLHPAQNNSRYYWSITEFLLIAVSKMGSWCIILSNRSDHTEDVYTTFDNDLETIGHM